MNTLKENKEWIELKATLRFVEDKILHIMDNQGWMMKKELEEQVKELLSDRHFIMGKMFRLHVTEQEVARFRDVNDNLLELTRKMFRAHKIELDSLKDKPFFTNKNDVVVESMLVVDDDAEVLYYDDDDDYGSNFSQMIDAIAWTEDLEIRSCYTILGEKPEPDHLDDGSRWSWSEGCLDVKQFDDIGVCYAVHDLCTHKNYSVPDILRIQSYSVLNTIKRSLKHID